VTSLCTCQTMRCWCAGRDAGWQGVHGRRRSSRPSSRPCRVRRGCRTRVQDESQTDQRPRHRSATHPYWCVGRNCWPLLTLGCLSDETKHTVYCMVPGTTDLALGSALSKLAIVYPHSLGVAAELSQRILLQLIYFLPNSSRNQQARVVSHRTAWR